MELTLKEKLYLYKDLLRLYEQLQNITLTLNLINANIDNNKEIEICIDKMEKVCIEKLNIIKKVLIDKLEIKNILKEKIKRNLTIDDILSL